MKPNEATCTIQCLTSLALTAVGVFAATHASAKVSIAAWKSILLIRKFGPMFKNHENARVLYNMFKQKEGGLMLTDGMRKT